MCVLRHLPAERPDPKLMLSPDPDRPLGIPAGKEIELAQATDPHCSAIARANPL